MFIQYKKHVPFLLLLFVIVIGAEQIGNAQEVQEEEAWVPSMLQAKSTTYMQLMQYGGEGIGWKYRGLNSPVVSVLNGIEWESKSLGFTLFNAMSGINSLFKTEQLQSSYERKQIAISKATLQSKQIILNSRFHPTNGRQYNHLLWSPGLQKQSWAMLLKLQEEKTIIQNPALGYKSLMGIAFSAEKMLANHARLSLTFWYNNIQQTKKSPTVMEAFELTGSTVYHPGWGWYNGQVLYPNTRQSNLPMAIMHYSTKTNSPHSFQLSWGFAKGKQSEDGLEWNATKDPRPDYYKYLPSYYKDSLLQQNMNRSIKENPSLLQLDFDQMKKINQSSKEGRSFYIINREYSKITVLQQAMQYLYAWNDHVQLLLNYNASFYKIGKSNAIANLLGGKYYLNYNSWVNDDGVDVFQFNIKAPDQKVIEGAPWGARYEIKNFDQQVGFFGTAQSSRWDIMFEMGYNMRLFQREGFNQNGLYPDRSLGKSIWYKFPSRKIQWESTYKQNPRLYYSFNVFSQQIAPVWKEAFVNISLQDKLSDFLLPMQQSGMSLGVRYFGIHYKTDWHMYNYWLKNTMGNTVFYHDYYNAFVQGNYGLLNTNSVGLEGGIETSFNGVFNFQLAFNWGKSLIMNNPLYSIQLLNNAYPLESGNLHLKNLPASSSPQIVLATNINAQLSSTFKLGFSTHIGWNRFMEFDYYRRSFLWEMKYKDQHSAGKDYPFRQLSNGLIGNFFCNKNFQFNTTRIQHRIKLFFQLNNIFNVLVPLLGFEQTRFDYKNFQVEKFPPKYMLGSPLNGSIQCIYQIN